MIDIRRDDEKDLAAKQRKETLIERILSLLVAVDPDIAAPIRPLLFKRRERIEAALIHIAEVIPLDKVDKMLLKARAVVQITGSRRKPCARTDNNRLRLKKRLPQALDLLNHRRIRCHLLSLISMF